MKQYQLNMAYPILSKLQTLEMPAKEAFKCYKLCKELKSIYEFEIEREKALLERYHGKVEDGKVTFENKEDTQLFSKSMQDLLDLEVEINYEKFTINLDNIGEEVWITPAEFELIEPFINIE